MGDISVIFHNMRDVIVILLKFNTKRFLWCKAKEKPQIFSKYPIEKSDRSQLDNRVPKATGACAAVKLSIENKIMTTLGWGFHTKLNGSTTNQSPVDLSPMISFKVPSWLDPSTTQHSTPSLQEMRKFQSNNPH